MRAVRRGSPRFPGHRPWAPSVAAALTALALAGGAGARAQGPPADPRACTLDLGPAATLLLPYFEVDLANSGGRTTLLSIVNASSAGRLANLTLWTDLGVPTLRFHVYLTGYDVHTLNLRDVLQGRLPVTAPAGQDASDTLSPRGDFSQDATVPGCAGMMPPPAPPADFVASLAAAHRGTFASHLGGCAGQPLGDGTARGYLTVDVVNRCTLRIPGDAGYFVAGGSGDASDENVLFGDFFLVDAAGNTAQSEPLVRVQAFPGRFAGGDETFYAGLLGGSAADDREPLARTWAARFVQRGAFSGGTDLLVWVAPPSRTSAFPCGGRPSWYPLTAETVAFDEEENPELFEGCPFLCPPAPTPVPFPAAANRVSMATAEVSQVGFGIPVATSHDFGWLFLGLRSHPRDAQGWAGQVMTAAGRYSVGMRATPLDSTCGPAVELASP